MQQSVYQTPLGPFYLWFEDGNLIYASFDLGHGQSWLKKHLPKATYANLPLKHSYQENLNAYFRGKKIDFSWPTKLIGTDFQKRVWAEIEQIPHGHVSTYKKLADKLDTKAYQAIGQAVGANPISLIIPCHRVLGTNWFGGYGGGLNLKRLLLELENVTLAPNQFA